MAERRRRKRYTNSSPEAEAGPGADEVTLKLGVEEVRKLKESFNSVLGSIEDELPGPSPGPSNLSNSERSGRKGGE